MIENLENVLSLVVIVALLLGGIFAFIKLNKRMEKDEADDYFRDLF